MPFHGLNGLNYLLTFLSAQGERTKPLGFSRGPPGNLKVSQRWKFHLGFDLGKLSKMPKGLHTWLNKTTDRYETILRFPQITQDMGRLTWAREAILIRLNISFLGEFNQKVKESPSQSLRKSRPIAQENIFLAEKGNQILVLHPYTVEPTFKNLLSKRIGLSSLTTHPLLPCKPSSALSGHSGLVLRSSSFWNNQASCTGTTLLSFP